MTARKPSRKASRKTAEVPVEARAEAPVEAPVDAAVEASVDMVATPTRAAGTEAAPPAERVRPRRADAGPPRPRQAGDGQGARPAPALDGADRGRLLAGDHHAPHDVLGAHPVPGGVLVRALRPFARSVTVLATGLRAELHDDGDGFFSGVLPVPEAPAYRLEVAYDDNTVEVADPYRFWPAIGELDLHLIGEGRHEELWRALGAEPMEHQGIAGTRFTLWAPNARGVRITGDFNYWDGTGFPMRSLGSTGVWELFLPGVGEGALYKYDICRPDGSHTVRADP
ncbi:GlgB N-terminal domain-containing protein, partial [Streptomyces sp. W007]